jgi:Flp pilus assembly protein TadG
VLSALKRLWGDCEGSALVEGALFTPMLATLFLGVFEFSWFFYNQQLMETGVRDAARYMARIQLTGSNTDPCSQTDADGTLFQTDAASIAVTGQTSGGTARVSGWTTGNVTISCLASPTGTYADGSTSMTIIYVTTSFPDPTFGFFPVLGLPAPSLTFTHQERYIGAS